MILKKIIHEYIQWNAATEKIILLSSIFRLKYAGFYAFFFSPTKYIPLYPDKIPKDTPWRGKRLVVASQILNRRRHIKHSCKSRRLTYPFRDFNYLRGNVGASFEFFPWRGTVCIDLVSHFYQAIRRERLFRDGYSLARARKTRIMKKRDCRQFRNRISVCYE